MTNSPVTAQPQHRTPAEDLAWSGQQIAALDAIGEWLEHGHGSSPFYLAGYAGTGKTTLAKEIGRRAGDAVFGAFTGKAADVMRRKGCADAATIDSLIYVPLVEVACAATPPCVVAACLAGDRCQHRRERFIGR